MGFGEITYNSMVNSLSNAQMDRLANPYYKCIGILIINELL